VLTQRAAFDERKEDLFPTAANVRLHLKALLENRRSDDTVFVAFSGHGVHLKKQNKLYFCPKGANLDDPRTLVSLDEVYEELKASKAGVRVLVADACRNDPLEGKPAGDERLESVTRPLLPDPPRGVAALFSCSKGQKSYESYEHKHGYFTHSLIEGLRGKAANKRGEVDLPALVQYVSDEVPEAVKAKDAALRQTPEPFLGIQGKVTLGVVAAGKEVMNGIGMKLVLIPAGTFWMGSAADEWGHWDNEGPRHEVEITQPFYQGKYEVTRGQFRQFVEESGYEREAKRDGKGGSGYNSEMRGSTTAGASTGCRRVSCRRTRIRW
jgi:hypothetical protein